jgi:hypothetical protein
MAYDAVWKHAPAGKNIYQRDLDCHGKRMGEGWRIDLFL